MKRSVLWIAALGRLAACDAAASDSGNAESTGTENRRSATPANRVCRSGRGS